MKLFRHVLNTWLLSHVFHPLLFAFFLIVLGQPDAGASIPVLFVAGPVVSLPALILSWLFLNCLYAYDTHLFLKQILWMLFMPAAIGCNFFLLALVFDSFESFFRELIYLLPAVLSSWIAILFRTYQFYDIFINKTTYHENSMV